MAWTSRVGRHGSSAASSAATHAAREDDRTHREGTPHVGTPGGPRDEEPAMAATRPGAGYGARRGETV
jgi:hypothetical protein